MIYFVFFEHGITVNEALLEGHPVALQSVQLELHLLWDGHLVLPEDVELVVERLKLGLNIGDV